MANWTLNDPLLTSFRVKNEDIGTVIEATVKFRSDGVEEFDKVYRVFGANAVAELQRRIFADRATLQAGESLTQGQELEPIPGTVLDLAVQSYTTAIQQHRALNALATLMGWADNTVIGTSGRTVAQVRTSLRNTIVADLTNDNRIAIALSNFPL